MHNGGSLNQHGWGVCRLLPWHMHGIYFTEAEANSEAKKAGRNYSVAFGSSDAASGNFKIVPAPGD
jgi:hypothetical protein